MSARLHAQCFVANTGSRFSKKRRSKSALWAITSTTGLSRPSTARSSIRWGDLRDLGRDRNTGVFQPFPRAEDFVDPPALTVVFEQADAEFDDFVAIGVGAGGFYIHDASNEFGNIVGCVVFGLRPQSTADTIIAALDERPSHLFECLFHAADIAPVAAVLSDLLGVAQ